MTSPLENPTPDATQTPGVETEDAMEETDTDDAMVEEETPAGEEVMDDEAMDADGDVVEIEMEMSNYAFSPDEITAQPGDTVRITLVNVEGTHDFVIDELDVASNRISQGEQETVEFTIPEDAAGQEYAFYCGVGNHRALGMEGTLQVEAN